MPRHVRSLITQVRLRIQEEAAGDVSGNAWTDPELLGYLNEGQELVALEIIDADEDYFGTFQDVASVASQAVYDLPPSHVRTRHLEYIGGGQRQPMVESRVTEDEWPGFASTLNPSSGSHYTYALYGDEVHFDPPFAGVINPAFRHWFIRTPPEMVYGKATAGAASTITMQAADDTNGVAASDLDDDYNRSVIVLTGGLGSGQRRRVTDYDASTKIATVTPAWTTAPDSTSLYALESGLPHPFHKMIVNFAVIAAKNKLRQDGRAFAALLNAWHEKLIEIADKRTFAVRGEKPFDPGDGLAPAVYP